MTRAPLLTLDPDLGRNLDGDELLNATRALVVPVARLAAGPWHPPRGAGPASIGLLMTDGLIVREIESAGNTSAELLSPGDIIRPWQGDDGSSMTTRVSWYLPDGARVAVLDGRLTSALARWPSVTAELFARVARRNHAQSVQRAIAQVRRLDHRTLLVLWHLGERIGRVTPQGVCMRLPVTHDRLATLVGAQRPSLTSALRRLEEAVLLVRGDDHEVVLTPAARDLVDEVAAGVPALAA